MLFCPSSGNAELSPNFFCHSGGLRFSARLLSFWLFPPALSRLWYTVGVLSLPLLVFVAASLYSFGHLFLFTRRFECVFHFFPLFPRMIPPPHPLPAFPQTNLSRYPLIFVSQYSFFFSSDTVCFGGTYQNLYSPPPSIVRIALRKCPGFFTARPDLQKILIPF